MPIVGTFEADFSQFNAETKGATTNVRNMEAQTHSLSASFGDLSGLATKMAGAFGVAFTVYEVVQFGRDVFETTSRLKELSQTTGISTDAIQRMSFVMTEFGVDTETIARAVGTLSARIGGGDASVVKAVSDLGLSIGTLQRLAPDDVFLQIAEAAGRVENPITKAELVSTLFGDRLARVLIPALGDLRAAMDNVPRGAIISEATIESASRFDAGLKQLMITVKAFTAEAISGGWHALKDWKTMHDAIVLAQSGLRESIVKTTDEIALMASHTDDFKLMSSHGIQPLITDADIMRQRLEEWRTEGLEPLNAEQRRAIELGNEKHKSDTLIAETLGISVEAVRRYIAVLKEQADAQDKLKASIDRMIASQSAFLNLLPLTPKDVTIGEGANPFQPTGAYKLTLDTAAAEEEHAKALALVQEQMKTNLILIGQTTEAQQEAGVAAKSAGDQAVIGYSAAASAIGVATQAAERFAVSQKLLMDLGEAQAQFNRGRATGTQEALLRGFEIVTARGGAPGGGGGNTIQIDARDSFFDTPEGQQRFFARLDQAIESKLRSLGLQVA